MRERSSLGTLGAVHHEIGSNILYYYYSGRSLRANVKSSMTHHSLEQYVGPATTSSVWQPARKTGKQASDCWMLPWSMHALSCGAKQGGRN